MLGVSWSLREVSSLDCLIDLGVWNLFNRIKQCRNDDDNEFFKDDFPVLFAVDGLGSHPEYPLGSLLELQEEVLLGPQDLVEQSKAPLRVPIWQDRWYGGP